MGAGLRAGHSRRVAEGLERDGVISRTVYAEVPPKVEYRLTETGQRLGPVFLALLDWAEVLRAGDAEPGEPAKAG